MAFAGLRRGLLSVSANDPNLANLLAEEKDFITSLSTAKQAILSSSKYMALWGEQESTDLQDITSKYCTNILDSYGMLFAELEDSQTKYREKMKEMKELTDQLYALKGKLKAANDKMAKAVKQNKNAESIQAEIGMLEMQVKDETSDFENRKRRLLQEALQLQYEGLMKFSLKVFQSDSDFTYSRHNKLLRLDIIWQAKFLKSELNQGSQCLLLKVSN
jgi:predicted RNase H-like nuclease (RuvC/YqgF family)